jgi:CPA1 family monovalent cation:H+ antiporter
MEHPIEHTTGIYIGLLLVACTVGAITKRITHLPYTIALTLVGLVIAMLPFGLDVRETGLSRDLIFFVMLPPLLFQGALHIELNRLLQHLWPILVFAIIGVLISMFIIGGAYYWLGGVSVGLVALLFGALISPTDPVSVLALFKEAKVPLDLRHIVEGESLFNDGIGVVIFSILLEMIIQSTGFHAGHALFEFVKVVAGGLVLGTVIGLAAFRLLGHLEDHLLENAICLVAAYGSFWLGEVLHVSGVIATVLTGLMIGNFGRRLSMSKRTTETIETFFESVDFLVNSLLFILIGLELQEVTGAEVRANLRPIGAALLAFLVARAVAVYPLYWLLNRWGLQRPPCWAHVLFWGGLRGSIPIALLLGLSDAALTIDGHNYRPVLLVSGFAVVVFSLVGQGLTMKPLLKVLKIADRTETAAT